MTRAFHKDSHDAPVSGSHTTLTGNTVSIVKIQRHKATCAECDSQKLSNTSSFFLIMCLTFYLEHGSVDYSTNNQKSQNCHIKLQHQGFAILELLHFELI